MYHTGFVRVNGPYYRCESNEPHRMCEVNETYIIKGNKRQLIKLMCT